MNEISNFHGAVTEITKNGMVCDQKSMAMICEDLNLIQRWHNNELEGGKGYPDKESGGLFKDYPDDVASATPPTDGHILSGGRIDARDCIV